MSVLNDNWISVAWKIILISMNILINWFRAFQLLIPITVIEISLSLSSLSFLTLIINYSLVEKNAYV